MVVRNGTTWQRDRCTLPKLPRVTLWNGHLRASRGTGVPWIMMPGRRRNRQMKRFLAVCPPGMTTWL